MMRPVLGFELGAKPSYIVSLPLNFLATSGALTPSFLWCSSQRVVNRFFPESRTLRALRVGRVLPVWPSSSGGPQFHEQEGLAIL